jgi:4-hydroxy-tetrahydrodipicolinate reductase
MRIAIVGYGKMGKKIEEIAPKYGHKISLVIDEQDTESYFNSELKGIDVIIEFSTPDAAFENIMNGIKQGVPVISGTTGWLDKMISVQDYISENGGSFLYASNFSIGMNLFFKINEYAAGLFTKWRDFNVHIEETHHTEKLDQPSGTAISLAKQILDTNENLDTWVNEFSANSKELSILSHRIADNPGVHEIFYQSETDIIKLKHQAQNREGLAKGALLAAKWIQGKTGVFGMSDVIEEL